MGASLVGSALGSAVGSALVSSAVGVGLALVFAGEGDDVGLALAEEDAAEVVGVLSRSDSSLEEEPQPESARIATAASAGRKRFMGDFLKS